MRSYWYKYVDVFLSLRDQTNSLIFETSMMANHINTTQCFHNITFQDTFYRGEADTQRMVFEDDTDASTCDALRCWSLASHVKVALETLRRPASEASAASLNSHL